MISREFHSIFRRCKSLFFITFMECFLCVLKISLFVQIFFNLLVDGGIHEKSKHYRCRTVDCHWNGGVAQKQIKSRVEPFCVIHSADRNTGITDFPVNIRTRMWVWTVERHRVKSSTQASSKLTLGQQMKTPVCTLSDSFTCKHAGRIFTFTFKRKNAGSKGEITRKIFQAQPANYFTPIFKFRCGDFRNFESGNTG